MRLPLEGVTVLDLSHALAGPFCSTMLADFGATVIKLEPLGAGDIARAWGPPVPGGETSYFVSLHRNKKGIEVDLKRPQGKELFLRLIERCDVVLENYRFGALAKLGLAYEVASKRNPGIIYCSVSGFGQDGPYRERAALDLILQAESGMISVTGAEGSHGVRCGVSIADLTAGMYAAFGIMLALRVKEKTGQGQAIDVSMLEGQLSLLGTMIGGYLADGELPEPMGTAYKALLPYQTFRTKTRDLALAVGSEKLWKVFCPVIGCPELADDPRYRSNADRGRNRESLIEKLQEVFLTKTYEDWEALFLTSGIPVGAINNLAQVVEHPQVKARNVLVEMAHPRAGKVRMVGAPVRLSATPGSVRTPAPTLGEHTDEVLRDMLGLTAAEIAALRDAGAIGPTRRPGSEGQRRPPRPVSPDDAFDAPGTLVGGGER
jgi:crotonobetainyl-CoA:carnitine CoA-transferase CaiB-like acyl-CoA transferase